jgi:heme exporter protein A
MRSPAVSATGVRRSLAGTPVLDGVDLEVAPGEVVALLGPNGAGKTTLLRVLALLLRPSAGRLALFGIDATEAPSALRRRVGWVGHESACYPDLTAAENLDFYAALFHLDDRPRRVADALTWSGLHGTGRRPVRAFSRGMSQRLALARAFLHAPDLLLLDEPFTGLDQEGVERLQEKLAALSRAGHAIVLATHDVDRVQPIATIVAILHRGRIAWTHEGAAEKTILASAWANVVTTRTA